MPRILRIINRLNIGGPTYNAAYLTKHLAPEFETILVAGMKDETEGDSEFILNKMGIKPRIINEMKREINIASDYRAFRDLDKLIKDFKPDIVHTHMAKPGTLGRLAAIKNNIPVILHTFHGHYFHSYFGKAKTRFFMEIERYLVNKTSGIIAISPVQKHELSNVFRIAPPEKTFMIPLGFDLSRFRENQTEKRAEFRKMFKIGNDEIAIGIIGRIVPVKNHKMFLHALQYVLANTTKKIRAFIIGDGELRLDTEGFARQCGIAFNTTETLDNNAPLTFTSWINEIDTALAGLDIVALCSQNEGTPVSLIEAQAASVPIVTTNAGGVENVVIRDKTALISDTQDTKKFSENLLMLIEDDTMRTEFSSNGWKNVQDRFHYTRLVNDMRILYKTLLKKD